MANEKHGNPRADVKNQNNPQHPKDIANREKLGHLPPTATPKTPPSAEPAAKTKK